MPCGKVVRAFVAYSPALALVLLALLVMFYFFNTGYPQCRCPSLGHNGTSCQSCAPQSASLLLGPVLILGAVFYTTGMALSRHRSRRISNLSS